MTKTPDFLIQNEGTIAIFWAETPEASDWMDDHTSATKWGVNGYVVEHGYVGCLKDTLEADGFGVRLT